MSKNGKNKVTSKLVATKAAQQLKDSSTPKKFRSPIASALAQARGKKKGKGQ